MDYPFDRSKEASEDDIKNLGYDKSLFPIFEDENSIYIKGCVIKEWKILFKHSIFLSIQKDKKYVVFIWSLNDKIKVKSKKYVDILNIEKISIENREIIVSDNLFETLQQFPNLECLQFQLTNKRKVPKLNFDNPSCHSIIQETKQVVFGSTPKFINLGNKGVSKFIEKIAMYTSAHNFKGVIFNCNSSIRKQQKEILNEILDNLSNAELKFLTCKIVLMMDLSLFFKDELTFKSFRKFIRFSELCKSIYENITICIDLTNLKMNSYYLLSFLLSKGVDISLIYIPSNINIILKDSIKLCIKNGISFLRKISPEMLIDDEKTNCYCYVLRNIISEDLCLKLFNKFKKRCIKRHKITVYDKETITPRTQILYANEEINTMKYSNLELESRPWCDLTDKLKNIVSKLINYTHIEEFEPNSCLVNGYIEKTDMVGAHRDKNLKDNIVCTVSIGGTRRFIFKPYKKDGVSIETELHNGDVVFMTENTNKLYTHEIPKYRPTKDSWEYKIRYSATFRKL